MTLDAHVFMIHDRLPIFRIGYARVCLGSGTLEPNVKLYQSESFQL